jgi:hypothetical protein
LLVVAGTSDELARAFEAEVASVNRVLRTLVLAVPPLVALGAYRACAGLQAAERAPRRDRGPR